MIAFYSQSIKLHPYSDVITKAFGCLLAASALFLGQKTVIQVIGKAKKIRDNDNMELTIIFSCQISSNCFWRQINREQEEFKKYININY